MPKFRQVSGPPCGRENGTCPPSVGARWEPVPGALDGNHPGSPQHSCKCPPPSTTHNCACPVAKTPVCTDGRRARATNCDPRTRTVNTAAACGAADDWYYYSPWRYPGRSPVIDACGSAGGRLPGQGAGGNGASYSDTPHAQAGVVGSKLPPAAPTATWKASSIVEVGVRPPDVLVSPQTARSSTQLMLMVPCFPW